jgi:hypothetical protein
VLLFRTEALTLKEKAHKKRPEAQQIKFLKPLFGLSLTDHAYTEIIREQFVTSNTVNDTEVQVTMNE